MQLIYVKCRIVQAPPLATPMHIVGMAILASYAVLPIFFSACEKIPGDLVNLVITISINYARIGDRYYVVITSLASYPGRRGGKKRVNSHIRSPMFCWGTRRMRMQKVPGHFPPPSRPGYEAITSPNQPGLLDFSHIS